MQSTPIELAVVKTLAYFDLFDYPLTLFELWQSLPSSSENYPDAGGLKTAIHQSDYLRQALDCRKGFYFLRGRENILEVRSSHYRVSLQKIKKARRIAGILKFIPFIRGILICNSLGYANPRADSDIDFLVLVEPGAIWTSRALAILLTEIFASRPREKKMQDTICLSFFSVYNQNLESFRLLPDDPCFDWWLTKLLPIYDKEKSFNIFFENNQWICKFRPWLLFPITALRYTTPSLNRGLDSFLKVFFSLPRRRWIEKVFERLQKFYLPDKLKLMANQDSRVVLSDKFLKFHPDDKRLFYQNELRKKIEQLDFFSLSG